MTLGRRVEEGRVLVLGDYRQTITVVRSLGRAGYEVTLGTSDPRSSTRLSRYVADVWVYDNASPQRFQNHLEAFLKSERPDFVFAVGETQLRHVIDVAARLEPLAIWANPDFATVARCFDKRATYELAAALGVPCMPWAEFTSIDEWRIRASELGFPLVVKRKDSSTRVQQRKALVLRTPEELESCLAGIASDPDPQSLLLQKFSPGVRHNCHIAAADGHLIAYFQQKVLRTDEADDTGIGVAGESVAPSPRLRASCEALVGALRYTGIGCIQFLVDESAGEVSFLELNARMDSTAALPYRLGLDFPLTALRLGAYRRARSAKRTEAERLLPPSQPEPYPLGRRYHWLYGDLSSWQRDLRQRRASAGRLALRVLDMAWRSLTSYHLTFEWRDPLPSLHRHLRRYLGNPLRKRLPHWRPMTR